MIGVGLESQLQPLEEGADAAQAGLLSGMATISTMLSKIVVATDGSEAWDRIVFVQPDGDRLPHVLQRLTATSE